jgi:uncharacterized membrane protein YtjA (UPF0391 family)
VLIVLGLGAVVVATLSMFKVTEEAAKPFAGILPLAIPAVHQLLQQSGSHLSLSPRKRGLVDRRGYALPLWMLALYGVLIVLAVFELMSGLTGIAGTSAGLAKEKLAYVGTPGLIPTMMVAYLVGRWIGIRSQSKGLFVVLAVAFFVPFIESSTRPCFYESRGSVGVLPQYEYDRATAGFYSGDGCVNRRARYIRLLARPSRSVESLPRLPSARSS